MQQPGRPSKQAILDELEAARGEFRQLIEARSNDDLRRKTKGTKWTNRGLLFHMLFGYLIVRTLLWFCVVLSRFAPRATRPGAALLSSLVGPFNWINFVGSVIGSRLFTPSRMVRKMDRVTQTLERRLRNASDDLLSRGMYYPTKRDPFFRQYMTIADGEVFGVSRQAIDQWRSRGVPAERRAKVADLLAVVDLLDRKLKPGRLPLVARRPAGAFGGRSLLELAAGDEQADLREKVERAFDWSTAA